MPKDINIDDRVWKKIKLNLKKAESQYVKVGIVGSSAGETNEEGFTMVELAAVHEFGSPSNNIPERSFIRRTFAVKETLLKDFTADLAKKVVMNKITIENALEILGQWGAAEIKNTIKEGVTPPLKPATIAAKGSSLPLVDTGQMLNSISHEVKK